MENSEKVTETTASKKILATQSESWKPAHLRFAIFNGFVIFLMSLYLQTSAKSEFFKDMSLDLLPFDAQALYDSWFGDLEALEEERAKQERMAIIQKDDEETDNWDDDQFLFYYKCNHNHGYRPKIISHDPMIFSIENFLQPGEAEHLRYKARPGIQRSMAGGRLSTYRTSATRFFAAAEDPVISCIELRASHMTNVSVENFEGLQAVRYRPGQYYQPHLDFNPRDTQEKFKAAGGPRIITIFAYLNTVDPSQGGATHFPFLNISVPAVKNSAAFWFNEAANGQLDERTIHEGQPVHGTVKWGLK